MKMDKVIKIYKVMVGVSAFYVTSRLLDKKTDELVEDGSIPNAFLIGAGQSAISMAVGIKAATIVGEIL